MPWDARPTIECRVVPNAVLAALAQTNAPVVGQVPQELASRDHARRAARICASGITIAAVTSTLTWTAVFDTVESGWVQARIAELPGVITVAPTIDEAKADLIDALHEYLASLAEPLDDNDASASAIRESVDLVIGS